MRLTHQLIITVLLPAVVKTYDGKTYDAEKYDDWSTHIDVESDDKICWWTK